MSYVGGLIFPTRYSLSRYIFLSCQWDVLHLCLNPSTLKRLNVQSLVPHLQSKISLFFDYPSVALTMSLEVIFSQSQTPSFSVATPGPGPTRLASPNRNPGDAHLILFICILLRFLFQKCRDPNPRPDLNGRSEPESGLLRRFYLSYQKHFY